ncbi:MULTISPECIES: hypothetical protein [unclassified Cryobacterium]|uniref:hypothetical protein n=1 Tax=unclassified Cryobacterium TaxID=2649013 RepID=UPI0011B06D4A|nr:MULTISPECIES: hypothetical protein [unclassified Cryobacterium]
MAKNSPRATGLEAAASLLPRDSANASLDFYVTADRADPRHTIIVTGAKAQVAALNAHARLDLIGQSAVGKSGALLHDGNKDGVSDVIMMRQNDRKLRSNQGKDFVANGDLWTILGDEGDDLKVKSLRPGGVDPAGRICGHAC